MKPFLLLRFPWRGGHMSKLLVLTDQAMVSGVKFLSTVYLARTLAPADFGIYSLATVTLLFFLAFHRAFVTQPLNILGAVEPRPGLMLRYRRLEWGHGPGWLICCAALLMLGGLQSISGSWIAVFALYCLASFLQEHVRRLGFTLARWREILWGDVICYALPLPLLLTLDARTPLNSCIVFGVMAVCGLLSYLLMRRALIPGRGEPSTDLPGVRAVMHEHWLQSRWVVGSQIVFFAGSQFYPYFLLSAGALAIANFSAAVSILNISNVLVQVMQSVLPMRFARLYSGQDRGEFMREMRHWLVGSAAAGACICGALFLCADWIAGTVFAGRYADLGACIRILSLAYLLLLPMQVLNICAIVIGQAKWLFYANAVAAVFTLTCGVWLIYRHGLRGALWSSVVSSLLPVVVQAAQLAVHFRRRIGATAGAAG